MSEPQSSPCAIRADSTKDGFVNCDCRHLRPAIRIDDQLQKGKFPALDPVLPRLGGHCSQHLGDRISHVAPIHLDARLGLVHHLRSPLRGEFFRQACRTKIETGFVHDLGAFNGLGQKVRGIALGKDLARLIDFLLDDEVEEDGMGEGMELRSTP